MGHWLGPRGRAAYAVEGKGFRETRPPLRALVIGSDHRDMVGVRKNSASRVGFSPEPIWRHSLPNHQFC